jgi:MinD-like ATPase involved in chromosome partitioning or flagellar assembly
LALLDESAGLAAAVRAAQQGALDADRLARLAPLVTTGLRVLTGLPRPQRWAELRPSGLDVVWARAREVCDVTLVDCGFGLDADEELSFDTTAPQRNGATLSALAAADEVVAVGAADPVGLQRLVRGLQDLREVLGPRRPRVVVTRVRASAVGPAPHRRVQEALARYAGVADAVLVPDDRPACDAAVLAGRSLTEAAPRSPARLALAALAADLVADLLTDPGGARPAASARQGVARRLLRAT